MKKLTDMVGIGIHVDDIITTAGRENIEGWNRFLLFYLFQEAGLVSSPLKNSTGATTQVDFNGFLVGRNKIKEEQDQVQVHEGRFGKERLVIELRDSTRHKLRMLIDKFRKERSWEQIKRLQGYMSWFSGMNSWYSGTATAVTVMKTVLVYEVIGRDEVDRQHQAQEDPIEWEKKVDERME